MSEGRIGVGRGGGGGGGGSGGGRRLNQRVGVAPPTSSQCCQLSGIGA